jgi:protocatechuate 3,4-dioxygenase beta subunit
VIALLLAAAVAAPWDLALAPDSEPGRKLVISGVVRKAPASPPLAGVSVYAYHADGNGLYSLKGQENKGPRLAGTLVTGRNGAYRIRTVFPGTYGGPPHVHFEVWGKGIPRRAFTVNLASPQLAVPVTSTTDSSWVQRAIEGRHPAVEGLKVVTRNARGELFLTYDLVLKNGFLMPK